VEIVSQAVDNEIEIIFFKKKNKVFFKKLKLKLNKTNKVISLY